MKKVDGLSLKGKVKVIAADPETGEIKRVIEKYNLVVNKGRELIGMLLTDATGYDTGITYCAWGQGVENPSPPPTYYIPSADEPDVDDVELYDEQNRKDITTRVYDSVSKTLTLTTFFLASEATGFIEDVGLFGHSSATSAKDSGMLFSRALLSINNNAGTHDITIEWKIEIG